MARLHPRDTKVGMIPLILGRSSTGDEKNLGVLKNIGFWNRTGENRKKNWIDFGIHVSVVNRGSVDIEICQTFDLFGNSSS